MDLNSFFLLFPSIFMLHEFEEILLFPKFMRRNPKLQQQFLASAFTPFRFNAIVCQEFILLLIVLGLSIYFERDVYKRQILLSSRDFLQTAPWLLIYPGLAIFITVVLFNYIGDALRDALDVSR